MTTSTVFALTFVLCAHLNNFSVEAKNLTANSPKVLNDGCRLENLEWVQAANGDIPKNAVRSGYTYYGEALYVGRAFNDGIMYPGKVHPSQKCIYYGSLGKEKSKNVYEVLVQPERTLCKTFPANKEFHGEYFQWELASNGVVPKNAVKGGYTGYGEPLYVGRAPNEGSVYPGKIHPSHGCLYYTSKGKEKNLKVYEVLVQPWVCDTI